MVRVAAQQVFAIGGMAVIGAVMLPWPPGGMTAAAAERPVRPAEASPTGEEAGLAGVEGLEHVS